MRNEDLRNKLNNIPQDFDREQLWSSIDLPKKKRKRRGLFWMFFAGIVAIGIISISIFNYQNNTPQLSTFDEEYEVNKSEPTNMNLVENNIIPESESLASLNSSQAKINTIALKKNRDNKVDEPSGIQTIIRRQNVSNDNTNYKDTQLNNHKSVYGVEVNFNEKESHNNVNVEPENFATILKNRNEGSSKNIKNANREVEKNVLLLPLPFIIDLLPKDNKFDLKIDQMIAIENTAVNKFGISFFTLLGKSNHDFGFSLNRTINETSLETFSFGLLGQIRLNKFELFPGFSFVKHNTVLKQDVQDITLLDGIKGPTRKTKTTQYALYNSYQYLDVNLGIGYVFSLGHKWSFRPSFHGSYTIIFDPKGDIINQNDELVQLSDLDEYKNYSKWQGRAHFEISREFSKYWKVGIIGYISTSKKLANFEDYSHSVSSQGFGISISRFFR